MLTGFCLNELPGDNIIREREVSVKKVLVIDDEEGFTTLVRLNLGNTGKYEVMTANDRESGIRKAERSLPDVIITDVNMPSISGVETAAGIREIEGLKDVPILFLSASLTREEIGGKLDLSLGYDCETKPISLEEPYSLY